MGSGYGTWNAEFPEDAGVLSQFAIGGCRYLVVATPLAFAMLRSLGMNPFLMLIFGEDKNTRGRYLRRILCGLFACSKQRAWQMLKGVIM